VFDIIDSRSAIVIGTVILVVLCRQCVTHQSTAIVGIHVLYGVFMFSLLMKDIREKSGVFEGQGDLLFFSHNVALLANDTYRTAGRLVAM